MNIKVYYLNREQFKQGDTKIALTYALKKAKEDKGIDTITLLVSTQHQYKPFLGELGINYKNHIVNIHGHSVHIHTVKTYHPSHMYAGQPQSEILIAIGVPPKELERFEDYSNIKYWIVIPWLMSEIREWLSIFGATDLESKQAIELPSIADIRIANAIDWLKSTSSPNEGYSHTIDENNLHQMANALKHYNVPVDYAATVRCAMDNGLIPSAARKTAEAFMQAQKHAFSIRHDIHNIYENTFLKEKMEKQQ